MYDNKRGYTCDFMENKNSTIEELNNKLSSSKIEHQDTYYLAKLMLCTGQDVKRCLNIRLRDMDEQKNTIYIRVAHKEPDIFSIPETFFYELMNYVKEKGSLENDRIFFLDSKNLDSAYRLYRHFIKKACPEFAKTSVFKIAHLHEIRQIKEKCSIFREIHNKDQIN